MASNKPYVLTSYRGCINVATVFIRADSHSLSKSRAERRESSGKKGGEQEREARTVRGLDVDFHMHAILVALFMEPTSPAWSVYAALSCIPMEDSVFLFPEDRC